MAKAPKRIKAKSGKSGSLAAENARLLDELNARNRDLSESLEQQTASAEILRTIAESTTDLEPVMRVIVENAARLLEARDVRLYRVMDGMLQSAGSLGSVAPLGPDELPINSGSLAGRAVIERQLIHIDDVAARQDEFPHLKAALAHVRLGTVLAVPMLREGQAIGVIVVVRTTVHQYTQKQKDLISSFADQAVIAIENARLLEELNARNRDLSESLDQQTATAEILRTIASSPSEAEKALDTICQTAARIFSAASVSVVQREGNNIRITGAAGPAASLIRNESPVVALDERGHAGYIILNQRQVQIDDVQNLADEYSALAARRWEYFCRAGVRTMAGTPLLHEGKAIGAIIAHRTEVKPFTAQELQLFASFADQAVIAIENARLLDELNGRNRDLSESLEQQTATAEVLRAIASSPGDAAHVLQIIADTARRLFGAQHTTIMHVDGEGAIQVASSGPLARDIVASLTAPSVGIARGTLGGRVMREKRLIHLEDVQAVRDEYPDMHILAARTMASAPLLREGVAIGSISVSRGHVLPFTDKQLELLQSFADQAVIAIENARLLSELRESLENQTASAEILRSIASAPGDAAQSLDTIAQTAVRLFGAASVLIRRLDGQVLRAIGSAGPAASAISGLLPEEELDRGSLPGLAILEKRQVQIEDADRDATLPPGANPKRVAMLRRAGVRTLVGTPLMREGEAIGAMIIHRADPQPFSDKDLALMASFADQAVIAIENARLLTELRESLDRQTATAQVLGVISSSPGELQPVFEAMIENAVRLCDGASGSAFRIEEDVFRRVASRGLVPELEAVVEFRYPPDSPPARMIATRKTVHIADLPGELAKIEKAGNSLGTARLAVERGGAGSLLWVPMVKDDKVIAAFVLTHNETRAFTEAQIGLVENFADQAVIAIENARLLAELREALDRQTATADILRVIASTPSDPKRALDTIAETAVRMFDASSVGFRRREGDTLHDICAAGPSASAIREAIPAIRLDQLVFMGPCVAENRQINVEDMTQHGGTSAVGKMVDEFAVRASAFTPLSRESEAIGVMVVSRTEPRPFQPDELELMRGFADQAVIAIENARLLTELRESLERRTATAEVLAVISSSPGDLQPVFEAMLENAVRLCEAAEGSVFRAKGDLLLRIASRGIVSELTTLGELRFPPGSVPARMFATKRTVHVPDLTMELSTIRDMSSARIAVERGGVRSMMWVPMVKDDEVIAAFVLNRREVRPFTEAQIGLVENFASQAVIAIENARLLSELRGARDEAERALGELKAAQASLIQAEKMASLGQLTAGIAHEIKNPLNFVNNFAGLSVELLDELKQSTAPAMARLGEDKRAEVDELIGMLTGNLEKVAEHGRRADGIVKSMLAHSRGGSGERQSVALNALIEESLNLAYHGARAQDQNFNVTLERDLDPSLAPIEVVPQDLTRVFLNLFGNGFYAANKRRLLAKDPAFRPILKVTTRERGADVEIRVRDNGTGIPPDIRDRLFEPFFTTKPTGEGTGLGLSISYEIVTQQHGGAIEVDSGVGEFTEFIVRLPRQAAAADKSPATDARP